MIQRTTKTDVAIVTELLDELGKLTPDQIAEKMRGLGITAKQACPYTCVMAQYYRRFGARNFCTLCTKVDVGETEIQHPESVQDFIANFDSNEYPDLIQGPSTHS